MKPPPIDLSILQDITEGDSQGMQYLTDLYLQNTREKFAKLTQAIERRDAPAVEILAHGCAGSSASFGATPLSWLMRELEMMGRMSQLENAPAKLAEAKKEFEDLASHLAKILPRFLAA